MSSSASQAIMLPVILAFEIAKPLILISREKYIRSKASENEQLQKVFNDLMLEIEKQGIKIDPSIKVKVVDDKGLANDLFEQFSKFHISTSYNKTIAISSSHIEHLLKNAKSLDSKSTLKQEDLPATLKTKLSYLLALELGRIHHKKFYKEQALKLVLNIALQVSTSLLIAFVIPPTILPVIGLLAGLLATMIALQKYVITPYSRHLEQQASEFSKQIEAQTKPITPLKNDWFANKFKDKYKINIGEFLNKKKFQTRIRVDLNSPLPAPLDLETGIDSPSPLATPVTPVTQQQDANSADLYMDHELNFEPNIRGLNNIGESTPEHDGAISDVNTVIIDDFEPEVRTPAYFARQARR